MAIVYIDTNIFIRAFEARDVVAEPARAILRLLSSAVPGTAVTSELTFAELLAPTTAAGAMTLREKIDLYDAVLNPALVTLVPISKAVLRATALLRATYPQKLPDAIHVVTADDAGCRFMLSSDRDMKRLPPGIARIVPDGPGLAQLEAALRA